MTELIHYTLEDGVATLTLDNGKVNAISPPLIEALHQALDRAEADGAVVVIAGQPGVFSGGYDLKVMTAGPESALALVAEGSALARRLLAHPWPVVAACTGHAVAKGALLLLAVDYRVGSTGAFHIGLNEVQIGMTMHHAGIALAADRLRRSALQRAVINAEMFDPQGALEAGFLDKLVPPEEVLAHAQAMARRLQTLNHKAHHQTKLKVRATLLAALDDAIEQDLAHSF